MTTLSVLQHAMVRVLPRQVTEPAPYDLEMPCRIWQGAVNSAGYGIIKIHFAPRQSKVITIQRLVYCVYSMAPIPDGLVIGHQCDRKLCGEFTHLDAISQSHNMRDHWARLRRLRPVTLTALSFA